MKFENLIYFYHDLDGKTIKNARKLHGSLVLTTNDNQFAVIASDFDEEDDDYYVNVLGPGFVFNLLRQDDRIRNFLKDAGVIDFEEFEKLVLKEREEEREKRESEKIENEKRLLAELKAKYETDQK